MPEFDIVVAGGGPAGLQFAREVATRTGHSIVVLEANDSLSDNDKSTGGTFHQVIDGFDVPESVIMSANPGVVFEGPTASGRLDLPNYVLDFPAFLAFLGRDAADAGAEIHTGVRVREPILAEAATVPDADAVAPAPDGGDARTSEPVTGVRARDGSEERTYRADLVVDATGPAGVLTEPLGMWNPGAAQRGIGKEFEVEGDYDVEAMLFRFDHWFAPGGYAWTFPAGDGVFKTGICWVDDCYERNARDRGGSIDDYVRRWLASDPRWEVGEIRAAHAGEAVVDNSINRRAADGIVAVGDAVSSINPLFGEGIRPGMESARMAADAAIDAFRSRTGTGPLSGERLRRYERRWNLKNGSRWKLQRIVGELLYDFTPDQQDRFVRAADDLSPAQCERLQRYELTIPDLLSLYPFAPRDLRKVPKLVRHLRA